MNKSSMKSTNDFDFTQLLQEKTTRHDKDIGSMKRRITDLESKYNSYRLNNHPIPRVVIFVTQNCLLSSSRRNRHSLSGSRIVLGRLREVSSTVAEPNTVLVRLHVDRNLYLNSVTRGEGWIKRNLR